MVRQERAAASVDRELRRSRGWPPTRRTRRPRRRSRPGPAPQSFDAIRSAHQATTQAFDSRVRQASTDASFRLKGTVLAVVLLALAAWYVIAQSRRRLLTELSEPLLALEQVVQQMAKGDHEVRAELTGPKEVRAVA